jgi:streptogramin lyase
MRKAIASFTYLFLILLAGCSAFVDFPSSGEAKSIDDAAHHGTNKQFYFLPPIAPQPPYTGAFDGSQSPVVTITDTNDNIIIARFSRNAGSDSEVVRVDTVQEFYVVNWHTNRFSLNSSHTYRIVISISTGTDEATLGYADVDVVSSGRELRNVDTGNYVALLEGRTLPIKFRIEHQSIPDVPWLAFGSLGSGVGQFHSPEGISVDPDGRIYVVDYINSRIVRIDDMNGTNWTSYDTGFSSPQGLALDSSGRIYIANYNSGSIVRMDDMSGKNAISLSGFSFPVGIAINSAGQIYVANQGNSSIIRIDDMNGTNWTTFGTTGSGMYQFAFATGIALDSSGRIYVADSNNSRIVRMDDMNGANWTTFGSAGSGVGQFQFIWGITFDGNDRIYVTDWNGRIVRIDDMTGTTWTTFGSGGTGINQFDYPGGIAVDASGYVLVSDTNNHRIVRLTMP